jgi:hypothetical protein
MKREVNESKTLINRIRVQIDYEKLINFENLN